MDTGAANVEAVNEPHALAVGRNIRTARELVGLTQPAVAEHLNRTQSAVSDWERGRRIPGGADIKTLADLFGVTTDSLLTE